MTVSDVLHDVFYGTYIPTGTLLSLLFF